MIKNALAWLAGWYAAIWCLPGALTGLWNSSESGGTPGYSYKSERLESCAGHFGCPTEPTDVHELLWNWALLLAPTLLVAVPLCFHLARKWKSPASAGFVSAFLAWVTLCAGYMAFQRLR